MLARRHMPADRNMGMRGVSKDHSRNICSHQPADEIGIGGVAADHAMGAEQEQIADPRDAAAPDGGAGSAASDPAWFCSWSLPMMMCSISSEPNPVISIGASAMTSSLNSACSSPTSQQPFSPNRLTANRSKRCSVCSNDRRECTAPTPAQAVSLLAASTPRRSRHCPCRSGAGR